MPSKVSPTALRSSRSSTATIDGSALNLAIASSVRSDGTTTDTIAFDAETDSKGVSASALGIWPVNRTWDVYARLGVIFATTTLTAHARNSALSIRDNVSEDTQDMLYGIGASYRYSGSWSVRLDYQHFDGLGDSSTTGETNVDRIAASWVYTFR